LAMEGVRFDCAYAAAPVCSASRACILTGKPPAQLHLTTYLPGRSDLPSQRLLQAPIRQALPTEEKTTAEYLKEAGYATACIGKWHLGDGKFGPTSQGFDVYWPGTANTDPDLVEGGKGEHGLTEKSIEFIRANSARPFFLYLCHNSPHIPLAAHPYLVKQSRHAFNPTYAAMINTLDVQTGKILDVLSAEGIAENTIIVFSSDNGGLHVEEGPNTPATRNDPFRGGKGFLYEGGLRIPMIVRWPARIPAGKIVREPVSQVDWLPSLLDFAGVRLSNPLEGMSLASLMNQASSPTARTFYWHFPHYSNQGGHPCGAIRQGDWKLIEDYESGGCELYNLAADESETHDLSAAEPTRVAELRGLLETWRRSVVAQTTMGNPDYQPDASDGGRGVLILHSRDAVVHGSTLRYEDQPIKDTLGCWSDERDYAEWTIHPTTAGEYRIDVLYGCGPGNGGSTVELQVGTQTLTFAVRETGHFQRFISETVGTVPLEKNTAVRVIARPRTKAADAVMDLRQISLTATSPTPPGALPALNSGFLAADMNVAEWKERFESESREIFTARHKVLDAMDLSPNSHVADIGAGTGFFSLLFSETLQEGWVYAVDISPKFIEHLRKRSNQAMRKNISCVLSSPDSIDLPPASVDRALICDTYHHFENPPQILKSIRESIKPGGLLVVIDFERIPGRSREWVLDHVRGGKETFCREITQAGFEYVDEIQVPGFVENYLVRFRRP
jgi:arylsulfatase A